jgi:AcrR family transcriptional regulator
MHPMSIAPNLRARVRAEMITEIKSAARRHLASDGANLSLRAVARELGMVSSALYRYFPSRDDLLTALILDAYNAVGEAAEAADAAQPRDDLPGRFLAICHAVRDWAHGHPHEYALLYGSPVPGYRAPQDTVGPATRPSRALAAILHDGARSGVLGRSADPDLPERVRADLAHLTVSEFPGMPAGLLARGMTAWIQLFGVLSFELFGHLHNVVADRDAFFDHQMRAMAAHVGVVPPA